MLWTVFMLLMFIWMLVLILQFGLGAIPLVTVLVTVLAFTKLMEHPSVKVRKLPARGTGKLN